MYQGGMVAKQEAEKRADAQLLGEKDVDLPTVTETSKVILRYKCEQSSLPVYRAKKPALTS